MDAGQTQMCGLCKCGVCVCVHVCVCVCVCVHCVCVCVCVCMHAYMYVCETMPDCYHEFHYGSVKSKLVRVEGC